MLTYVNPNSIENLNKAELLAFIEDGRGNWHHSVFMDPSHNQILFVEHSHGRLFAAYGSASDYGLHIKCSNWINCRGKYAKVLKNRKKTVHSV